MRFRFWKLRPVVGGLLFEYRKDLQCAITWLLQGSQVSDTGKAFFFFSFTQTHRVMAKFQAVLHAPSELHVDRHSKDWLVDWQHSTSLIRHQRYFWKPLCWKGGNTTGRLRYSKSSSKQLLFSHNSVLYFSLHDSWRVVVCWMQQGYWWFWQVLIIKRVNLQGCDFKTCSPFSSLYFDWSWSSDNISNQHNVLDVSNEISLSHMSFCPFSWVWLWKRAQTRPYEETRPCLTTSAKKKYTDSDANFSRRKHFLFR